jgi:heme exporter protein C
MSWRTVLFVLAALGAVAYALSAPDAPAFREPALARIIFFHLPCAFVTTGLVVHGAWLGWRYLATRDYRFDARNTAAVELTALFATLTMLTGVLFSKVQWGAWWQNDPRQTSFLVLLLFSYAGVALRSGLADDEKAARATAAYSVAFVLPGLFLIFVLPRIIASFHPSNTIVSGGFGTTYWTGIFLSLIVLVWATRVIYVERARLTELRYERANDPGRAGLAGPDTRRPVAVPRVGAEED